MKTLVERVKTQEPNTKIPELLHKQIRDDLYHLIYNDKPLLMDEFEGKIFMLSRWCGKKPCKGYYQ